MKWPPGDLYAEALEYAWWMRNGVPPARSVDEIPAWLAERLPDVMRVFDEVAASRRK